MGVSDNLGTVQFANTNPLQFWKTDGLQGINRRPLFNIDARAAGPENRGADLGAGHSYTRSSAPWKAIRTGRRTPALAVHLSIGTAARDPLFFLLHCNVDRLWAKWQRQNSRFNPAASASFATNGAIPSVTICRTRCGHGTA